MTGRIVWIVLLAAIGLCAAGLELDRETRRRPELATLVPEPFRGFAWPTLVSRSIRVGDGARAEVQARRLVAARPVAAENLSVLAVAASRAGDEELAVGAIRLSASRGWREPLAQALVADAAIRAGDWPTALQRVAALWSTGSRGEGVAGAFNRIAAAPEGRATVAHWLLDKELERDGYLAWGTRNLDPGNLAAAVRMAIEQGARFDCDYLASAADRALRLGHPRAADMLWSGACAASAAERAQGLAFVVSGRGGGSGPFGWVPAGSGRFERSGTSGATGWRLRYDNDRPGTAPIARRAAALAPGRYIVAIENERDPSALQSPLKLGVRCLDTGGDPVGNQAIVVLGPDAPAVTIPGEDCAVQEFELRAPRGAGQVNDLRLVRQAD